jgi:tyrosine decarboxylase/aspartate 1-decarboxylase
MVLETESIGILRSSLKILEESFDDMPDFEKDYDYDAIKNVMLTVAERMKDNFPYAHPLYAGQMLNTPHPIARLAYMLSLWVNPNNHALDGGRASSALEKEAVANIAAMFGWNDVHLGHLTGGGTMANLEALWVAGKLHPGKTIVASSQAHYTHSRITDVLKIPFQPVAVDHLGRMDMVALEMLLATGEVGTVVVTLGTTGVGSVDRLPDVLKLQEKYEFRIHVDAAYGGYHVLAQNLAPSATDVFANIHKVDSIVVDPHKCGLQPFGCGCVLFKDPTVGSIYSHDSPYTYFSSDDLHLGEISLECSRPGGPAIALWATQQLLPMKRGGVFANGIEEARSAALKLYRIIDEDPDELAIFEPELDILVWAPRSEKASEISAMTQRLFDETAEKGLHIAVIRLPATLLQPHWPGVTFDTETVCCLRSCLMKPEHLAWSDQIWRIYKSVR